MARYTFSTLGTDNIKYYPKLANGAQGCPISDWTVNINEAMTWNSVEDFDCLMLEYCNTTVETVGSSEPMNNVMLDIETLGTSCNSAIIQIALIRFSDSGEMGDMLSIKVDYNEQLQMGAEQSKETLEWWKQTNLKLFESLTTGDDILSVRDALYKVTAFITKQDRIWSHSYFDASILSNLYRLANIQVPWVYKKIRDIRTLTDIANIDLGKFDWKEEKTHDSLDDCKFQIKYCSTALQLIKVYIKIAQEKWDEEDKNSNKGD